MRQELPQFLQWAGGELPPEELAPVIVQEKESTLRIADADSDVLFESERLPLTPKNTRRRRRWHYARCRFSGAVPLDSDPDQSALPPRKTFTGRCRGRRGRCTSTPKM